MKGRSVVGVAVAVATTVFLYVKTQTVDAGRNDEIRQSLLMLNQASSQLSEDVLKLRCSLLTNYDSLARSNALSVAALDRLQTLYVDPKTDGERETRSRIDSCRSAIEETESLSEQFKSLSAVLDNSLDYLPSLGYSLTSSELGNAEAVRKVDDLVRDVLIYNRGPRTDFVSRIRRTLEELKASRPRLKEEHPRDLDFLFAHVDTVLRTKPQVDALLTRVVDLPVSEMIEELRASAARDYDHRVRAATAYRRALVVFSAILVFGIAFTLIQLSRKARDLDGANLDLNRSMSVAARKEAETRAILEGVADAIITLDEEGRVKSLNPAAELMFGRKAGGGVGPSIESFLTTPWDALRKTLGTKQEAGGRTHEGTTFALELSLSKVEAGDHQLFVAVMQDITERKKVDRLKNEFISTVSHELRTPLTSIRGSLGLLTGGVAGPLPPKAAGMIGIAYKNSERLVRLVNDILDIEKLEVGKMEFKNRAVDLLPLLKQTVDANRTFAQSFGVDLRLESTLRAGKVFADYDRLTQVLTNLISNACKFSPRGEQVLVRLARAEGKMCVSVSDHGPGIPMEFRSRIFQKFAQADGSDGRQRQGSGLGLSISKAIIEKQGGRIGFDSEVGRGSTFFFELPELEPPLSSSGGGAINRPWILVCEDEPDIASILVATLDQAGYNADIAQSADQAKECLKNNRYDGMTLDLALPDCDGISLVRDLRQNPETRHLPIVVVSAYIDEGRRSLNGEAFGIVDWLEKPINETQLFKALEQAVPPARGKQARVLHVEDDPDIVNVVRLALEGCAEIVPSPSLEDARQRIRSEEFDLLILDIGLPDGSGLELLPALRGSAKPTTPVLVFSAQEVTAKTARHVAAALLKSKTTNEEFVVTIRRLLGLKPASPELQPVVPISRGER